MQAALERDSNLHAWEASHLNLRTVHNQYGKSMKCHSSPDKPPFHCLLAFY
jgi:hypothetical protein